MHGTRNLFDLGIADLVQKPSRLILVLGDGDLSFAYSLVVSLRSRGLVPRILASTFDAEDELREKYARAPEILERMKAYENVKVLFGVDARDIKAREDEIFGNNDDERLADRIIFNFPHYGGRSKVQVNKKLVEDICVSAADYLNPERGELYISLMAGQGGTQAETYKRLAFHNTWQVQNGAAHGGLLLKNVTQATLALENLSEAVESELGYLPKGYHERDLGFRLKGSITHIFAHPHPINCPRALFPMAWKFSLGFHYDPENFKLDILHNMIRELAPGVRFETEFFSHYHELESGRLALTYRIKMISLERPISKRQTHDLLVNLRERLKKLEEPYLEKYGLVRLDRLEIERIRNEGDFRTDEKILNAIAVVNKKFSR